MNFASVYSNVLRFLKKLGITTGFLGLLVTGASTYSTLRDNNVVRAEKASLDIANYLSKTEAFGRPCLRLASRIENNAVLARLVVGNDNSGTSFSVVRQSVPHAAGLEEACLSAAVPHYFEEDGLAENMRPHNVKDDVDNYRVFRHVLIDIANLFDSKFILWKEGVLDQYTMCEDMKGLLPTTESSQDGSAKVDRARTTSFIIKLGMLAPSYQRVARDYPGLAWAVRTRGYCGSRVISVWREYFDLFIP